MLLLFYLNTCYTDLLDAVYPEKLKVWGERNDAAAAGGVDFDVSSEGDEDSGAEDLDMMGEEDSEEDDTFLDEDMSEEGM